MYNMFFKSIKTEKKKMKVKITDIKKVLVDTTEFFGGKSCKECYKFTITCLEPSNGMFYIGNMFQGVVEEDEEIEFNVFSDSIEQAIYDVCSILDVTNITSTKTEVWFGKDQYNRVIGPFKTQEEAEDRNKKFGGVFSEVEYSNIICN